MMPEEDVVTLVVEGYSPSTLEVRVLAKDGGKHAPKAVP